MNNMVKLFSGSSHPAFASAVANALQAPLRPITLKQFSCGETYIRFDESLRGFDVYLIQTGVTGSMNDKMVELLLMIDAAKQSFANSITVVLPYMPYSRQDKIHDAREGISAKLWANLIVQSGADRVITLHLHADQIQGFFDCPVDNLSPRKIFAQYFKDKNIENAVVVSPDAGGAKDAKKFANQLGLPFAILHKQRPGHNLSEITHVIGDVKGKVPIILDDMVDTAGSVCAAKKAIVEAGAIDEVYLVATHGILSGPAYERLNEANFAEVVLSDSLPIDEKLKHHKSISIAPLFADVIAHSSAGKSVSALHF